MATFHERQAARDAFEAYHQATHEPMQDYITTKCSLYREAYKYEDLQELIDEIVCGVRNKNIKHILLKEEFGSIEALEKRAVFLVSAVTKMLKAGCAYFDSWDGLVCADRPLGDAYADEVNQLAPERQFGPGQVPARS